MTSFGYDTSCGVVDNILVAVKVTMAMDWIKIKSDIKGKINAPVCSKKIKQWP